MSVRTIERADAPKYEVRWRHASGQHRSRTFDTPEAAERFDLAVHAWQAKRRADEAWDQIPRDVRELVAVHG